MTPETAISIRNLSKEYYRAEKTSPFSRKSTKRTGFLAVNDISLDIQKGEVICISGHNGSGKSTLLKMIAEVTQPTSGEIEIDGKVASILEIGIGFQPEISGYENIFLSGAMYGLKKSEIEKKINKIIDMFGFPEFINTPVKYYSSGMYMRLAFSVIVNIEADIYLFDEVTSVGDTEFRTKVTQEIIRLKKQNATILVVTHTPALFAKISDKFVIFDKGKINISKTIQNAITNPNDNPLHISLDTLKQIKETYTSEIDFDLIEINIITTATDLSKIFDTNIELKANFKYKSDIGLTIVMAISDQTGNIITSASADIPPQNVENQTITFEIPSGYLRPSPIGLNADIIDNQGKTLISYPNIANMPFTKDIARSGYVNIPIKVTIN
ncbi:MAG: ABC transporter ATP-binding protein [Bacteroidales bacterium]|nr:ABC transporter ATP-binding protein [Bacteroidales bacterium]